MANREYQNKQFRNRGRFEERARGEDAWENEGGGQWPGRDEDVGSTRHMRPGGGDRARTWSSEGAGRERGGYGGRRGYGERRGWSGRWGMPSQGESGERGTRDFEEDRGYGGSERGYGGYGAERGARDYELGERGDGDYRDEWRDEGQRYGRGRGFGGARSGYAFGD